MKGLTIEQLRSTRAGQPAGSFTRFLDESFYKIGNYDAMDPFFMTIVSSSDIWNFLWSNGALTAGRINSDNALFPYYTADKVYDARHCTGPHTAVRTSIDGIEYIWEPFTDAERGLWRIERNLYKNTSGSKVYFEEINRDLDLAFQYGWMSSDAFGLVRHARIVNLSGTRRSVTVLDGCRNILPACVTSDFQNDNSVLLDAYKKTDLDEQSDMAVFSVTSIVTDKAEPNEGLLANTAWFSCTGTLHLSPAAPDAFRCGEPLPAENVLKGSRASFFIQRSIELAAARSAADNPGATAEWYQVFDTGLDLSDIVSLRKTLADRTNAQKLLEKDIAAGVTLLEQYIEAADGMQDTADTATCVHHEANVLFNIMRGGVFAENDRISTEDFVSFIEGRNSALAGEAKKLAATLGEKTTYRTLQETVTRTDNPQLERLFLEYLPLTFSRRHGDPSRPWNRFSIELKDARGNRKLSYQGNWRDIFQNWEALALSYPRYLDNMTAKFLNATTPDGFNPYRLTREGIDWEVQEHDNPWSNIGYWGDHQIIYLAKLLELQNRFDREGLLAGLDGSRYSSANVPYRLKKYADIVTNPRSTIVFDEKLHGTILEAARRNGSDAKLVQAADGQPALVSLTTKLLSLLCAKMANLVPGGGIWLNTQRPEWNDANNALAGYGLSMVTLYYIRRLVVFLLNLYRSAPAETFGVPSETAGFFDALALLYRKSDPAKLDTPAARRAFMDAAGTAFEAQREALYAHGFSPETRRIPRDEIVTGMEAFLRHTEFAIRSNRRDDGLFHAYNTLSIAPDGGMHIHTLTAMLEGQVAVLSSGILSGRETIELCRALKTGPLFRADQYSYILYPEKELPLFCAKNAVSAADANAVPLLSEMLRKGDTTVINADSAGGCHFNPAFRNARAIDEALEILRKSGTYTVALLERSGPAIHELYEKTFRHQSFTGRSGTFYAYEGLGSIYWHMVSKLLLAVQEIFFAETDEATRNELALVYYDIRMGIGFNKTPEAYGAFPTDPYSHTPAGQGAKQPGMTGQVKEEIITRWGELGLVVENGCVSIRPSLLRSSEFHPDGSLSFSWCGTPFVYRLASAGEEPSVTVTAGEKRTREGNSLTREESQDLFDRNGRITRIEVRLHPGR